MRYFYYHKIVCMYVVTDYPILAAHSCVARFQTNIQHRKFAL